MFKHCPAMLSLSNASLMHVVSSFEARKTLLSWSIVEPLMFQHLEPIRATHFIGP